MASNKKYVYFFGGGKAEGMSVAKDEKGRKAILGGKGSGLADMAVVNLPVPPGFTITTESCDQYYQSGRKWPAGLEQQIEQNIAKLEKLTGKSFGTGPNPLLVSVRSGAAVSMPGMMDTVLNLGLNDESLASILALTGNERFAWDSYRRFMQMFGDVVLGLEHHDFEHALQGVKDKRGVKLDTDLDIAGLREVVAEYKKVYERGGKVFPQDAREQLRDAINAVFQSWNNPRAIKYRQLNDIRGLKGTAVNVQTMVFGNMGNDSGTGVAFTRDPSTGENRFYGEFLMNAQGEDVVAGIRTPQPIDTLAKVDPPAYKQLVVAGIDIHSVIAGAKAMAGITRDNNKSETNPALIYAAARNLILKTGRTTEILVGFNPKLHFFSEWWKQLYGESEGKDGKGIFPASVDFTTDLHSLGQYIQEGQRILFETFLSIKGVGNKVVIPLEKDDSDQLNFLAGKRLSEVNRSAETGTILAHNDGMVPVISINIPHLDEYYVGQLIYFFEIACVISGYILDVNPFDQPGVEAYKKNMFALLNKPGFEEAGKKIRERLK